MSRSIRLILILLGLLMICCSLAVLLYLNLPADPQNLQATLEPTLFISP